MIESGRVPEKAESVRVSKNCPGEYWKRVESVWVPKNDRIRASTGKRLNPFEYRKTFRVSTEKIIKLLWVPKNDKIPASTEIRHNPCLFRKTIRVPTGNGSYQCEYRKMVESGRLPVNGRIRAIIEKLFGWVPKNARICVSTKKW